MTKESLITIMELLSAVEIGPITTPNFEAKLEKLLKLKKEVEEALNGDTNITDTVK